jgi:ribosomal protein L11 methyltransferase
LIRLAVRCSPAQAEAVLAELTVLAPNGVEEEQGPDYVEYALYGGDGELPDLGEIEAAAGDGLVEVAATEVPDDWADRWRDFHRPILVGGRLWVRPSWTEPQAGTGVEEGAGVEGDAEVEEGAVVEEGTVPEGGKRTIDVVVDPGRAFGTGAHQTTRLCLELLLELEAAGEPEGELTDLGCGSGVLAIAAAKLGWGPVSGYDHEAEALEAAAANAAANGVELTLERINLRERLPALAPTVLANMTSPILIAVAGLLASSETNELPETIACSGILPTELDDVAAAFAAAGLAERKRRREGDWAALLLQRP